jgi:hypothetical protein
METLPEFNLCEWQFTASVNFVLARANRSGYKIVFVTRPATDRRKAYIAVVFPQH